MAFIFTVKYENKKQPNFNLEKDRKRLLHEN